jgi:CrcB protein
MSAGLPIDSDLIDEDAGPGRTAPSHGRWSNLGIVAAGGVLGTAIREGVTLLLPGGSAFPVVIFGINILGAFALGLLLELLVRTGPDVGLRQRLRLLLGTGVLGGFTTYSALATDAARLLAEGQIATGLVYGILTVATGAVATWLGILLGSLRLRGRGVDT